MDEKTEELRDIFVNVTDEETVTDEQEESRGSLSGSGDPSAELGAIVARMRERYEFSTSLSDAELVTVVEGFYSGLSDGEIAEGLDCSRKAVITARLDLHLICDRDTDSPFDLDDLRELLAEDQSVSAIAEELAVAESTVGRYRRVIEAQNEARQVSDRFRSEFEDAIPEASLDEQLTSDVTDDGLQEATDGMETDVSF